MNDLAEIERNLRPSRPEHNKHRADCGESQQHVGFKKETGEEENDKSDGDEGEKYSGNQGGKKTRYFGPERNSRLRSREFGAAALGAYSGAARINVQPRTEFYVITSAAKVAEQRLSDRDPITVVAIFPSF